MLLKQIFPANEVLQNGYLVIMGDHRFVRSGVIDTPEKEQEMLNLIHQASEQRSLKVLSCQINHPLDEWEDIQIQHLRLTHRNTLIKGKGRVAHLLLPVDYLLINPLNTPSHFASQTEEKLCDQLNIECWMTYFLWFNEEAKRVLKTFKPEAAHEYQLQALIEDFGIEVNSLVDLEIQQELQKTLVEREQLLSQGDDHSPVSMLSLEKRIISHCEQLKRLLPTKINLLKLIVEGVEKIQETNPELLSFKILTFLLLQVVGETKVKLDWAKKFLLLQLLNQQLGVVTAVNCHDGLERTSMAFSLVLSISEISSLFSTEKLVYALLQDKPSKILQLLQKHVWKNFKEFSFPLLLKVHEKKTVSPPSLDLKENEMFLKYLPPEQAHRELLKRCSSIF